MICKASTLMLLIFDLNSTPLDSPLYPQPRTILIHSSSFKNFKFHSLQVWTRFAKFGEIHIYTSPKIPPKFRQPLVAMRDHSTKNQLKEKSLDAKIILSNTWHALFCSYSVNSESSVSSPRQNFSHMPTVHLARCSQPLPLVRSSTRALGAFLASVAP